jgi:hypothetical protein
MRLLIVTCIPWLGTCSLVEDPYTKINRICSLTQGILIDPTGNVLYNLDIEKKQKFAMLLEAAEKYIPPYQSLLSKDACEFLNKKGARYFKFLDGDEANGVLRKFKQAVIEHRQPPLSPGWAWDAMALIEVPADPTELVQGLCNTLPRWSEGAPRKSFIEPDTKIDAAKFLQHVHDRKLDAFFTKDHKDWIKREICQLYFQEPYVKMFDSGIIQPDELVKQEINRHLYFYSQLEMPIIS